MSNVLIRRFKISFGYEGGASVFKQALLPCSFKVFMYKCSLTLMMYTHVVSRTAHEGETSVDRKWLKSFHQTPVAIIVFIFLVFHSLSNISGPGLPSR